MPIMFNTLLREAGIPFNEVILLRHQDQRATRGRSPYELWRDDTPAFDLYQSLQGTDGRTKFVRARYWASFVGTPAGETLFVGLYKVTYRGLLDVDMQMPHRDAIDKAGSCDVYDLVPDERLQEYVGKLLIDWGRAARAWVQRADKQDKSITELRPAFKEDEFPGFMNFISAVSGLPKLPKAWVTALRATRGVYVLACPRTREQYVGSATGADGFWQRWHDYERDGHGGNIGLKSREPSDYQVSILQVAGTDATTEDIVKMEEQWKRKLQSKEMGLNR